MLDRNEVLAVLEKCFPDATPAEIAGAADVLAGLEPVWEEVTAREGELGYHYSAECSDICYLAQQAERGDTFRLFRRRAPLRR
jgi:hypothetical protein